MGTGNRLVGWLLVLSMSQIEAYKRVKVTMVPELNNSFMSRIHTFGGKEIQLEYQLGKGSYGSVYSAYDIHTKQSYAVKLEYANISTQLVEEARVMETLNDTSGIPHIYWQGAYDDMNVMLLERTGSNLEAARRALPHPRVFPVNKVLSFALHLMNALQGAHELGYTHRDIKPSNIAFSVDNSSVFLLDFGISKWFDGIHRKTNSFHGSLVWAGYYNTVGIGALLICFATK